MSKYSLFVLAYLLLCCLLGLMSGVAFGAEPIYNCGVNHLNGEVCDYYAVCEEPTETNHGNGIQTFDGAVDYNDAVDYTLITTDEEFTLNGPDVWKYSLTLDGPMKVYCDGKVYKNLKEYIREVVEEMQTKKVLEANRIEGNDNMGDAIYKLENRLIEILRKGKL